jgi:hypothetical protein
MMARTPSRKSAVPGPAVVEAPAGYEVLWVDPATVAGHPGNWKLHPDDQTDAVSSLIGRYGWLKPLVYNRRFSRLLDGHDRITVAVRDGLPAVPLWVVDVDEAAEAEILVALDETARMSRGDPAKLHALLTRFKASTPTVSAMLSRMSDREGVTALLDRRKAEHPFPYVRPAGLPPGSSSAPAADLRRHPRDYRSYPDDQITHLAGSFRDNGFHGKVVVARDGTVLEGFEVVLAARALGLEEVPVIRMDLDPGDPRALKVLAADSGIGRLGEVDDRALTELLRSIKDTAPGGLEGTGYDERMLANLVFVTRPASEIKDFDAAAAWVGMPAYDPGEETLKVTVSFRSREDREAFGRLIGQDLPDKTSSSVWWPPKARNDLASVRFEG